MSRYPNYYAAEQHRPSSASVALFSAIQLAIRFVHRTPTVRDLREDFGMSRATAYRWLAAIKAAKGEA